MPDEKTMVARVQIAMRAKREELIAKPLAAVWPDLARAAIEAMREPSEAQVYAGGQSLVHPNAYMNGPPDSAKRNAGRTYKAMIDTALSDSPSDQGRG